MYHISLNYALVTMVSIFSFLTSDVTKPSTLGGNRVRSGGKQDKARGGE